MKNTPFEQLYLLALPFAAALSCFGGISVGMLRHTGAIWIATLFVGVLLLLSQVLSRGIDRIIFPWIWWLPFYLYLFASLLWSDMGLQNFQLAMQMAVYPVVGMVAAMAIRKQEDLGPLNWLYFGATLFIGVVCCYFIFGPGAAIQTQDHGNYIGFAERPAGTTLTIVGAIFLAQFRKMPLIAFAVWCLALVFCILSGGRMVTLVLIALWIVHPRLANWTTRFAVLALAGLITLAAFSTPIIQDRFFDTKTGFAGKGNLDDVVQGKFHSSGRFEAWPIILKKANTKPLLGHGLAQSAPYVYKVWPPMDKPHNEYLKIFFEGGSVGLSLFLLALVATWLNLSSVLRQTRRADNWVAPAAYMGFFAFVTMAFVDNPLVYGNNFMHPLFALIGAANALLAAEKIEDEQALSDTNTNHATGAEAS